MDAIKAQIEVLFAEQTIEALIELITVIIAKVFNVVAEDEGLEYVG